MISVCGEAMQALEQKACGEDTELFHKTHIAREMSMFLLEPVDRANYSRRSKLTDKIISTLNRMRSYERTKLRKLFFIVMTIHLSKEINKNGNYF